MSEAERARRGADKAVLHLLAMNAGATNTHAKIPGFSTTIDMREDRTVTIIEFMKKCREPFSGTVPYSATLHLSAARRNAAHKLKTKQNGVGSVREMSSASATAMSVSALPRGRRGKREASKEDPDGSGTDSGESDSEETLSDDDDDDDDSKSVEYIGSSSKRRHDEVAGLIDQQRRLGVDTGDD